MKRFLDSIPFMKNQLPPLMYVYRKLYSVIHYNIQVYVCFHQEEGNLIDFFLKINTPATFGKKIFNFNQFYFLEIQTFRLLRLLYTMAQREPVTLAMLATSKTSWFDGASTQWPNSWANLDFLVETPPNHCEEALDFEIKTDIKKKKNYIQYLFSPSFRRF